MTELITKFLQINLDGSLQASYGDLVLNTDMETVTNAVTNVVGAVGAKNCLKLGAAAATATAVLVAAKSLSKHWSWMTTTDVKSDNVLELAVPPQHEAEFDDLVAKGTLKSTLQTDFEDLGSSLPGIVGEETYKEVGNDVVKLIGNVRVKSIEKRQEADLPKDMTVGEILKGQNYDNIRGKHDLILGAEQKGLLAERFVTENAVSKRTVVGGGTILAAGYKGDDVKTLANLHEKVAGDLIQLKIKGTALSEPFERKFKATETIDDVIRALKKDEKRYFHIVRNGEILDDDMTIAQLQQTGPTVTLEALTDAEHDALKSKSA